MIRGRTDEPLTTDTDVRHRRARRMACLIRKLNDMGDDPLPNEDTLAQFISKCLLAHECDTLALVCDIPRSRAVIQRNEKGLP